MNDEHETTGAIAGVIFCLLVLVLAVWWHHSTYVDCMALKNDDIICTTYVNSFFN